MCREVGPQPRQDYYSRPLHPEMSLETQPPITPPEPMQKVGEQFFADQAAVREPPRSNGSSNVFIDDGDDDEPPVTEPGRLEQ